MFKLFSSLFKVKAPARPSDGSAANEAPETSGIPEPLPSPSPAAEPATIQTTGSGWERPPLPEAAAQQLLQASLIEALDMSELSFREQTSTEQQNATRGETTVPSVSPASVERAPQAPEIQSMAAPALPTRVSDTPSPQEDAEDAEAVGTEPVPQKLPLYALAEDVVAAYKLFLGRLPENLDVVKLRVGYPVNRLFYDFAVSPEFLQKDQNAHAILALTRQLLAEQARSSDEVSA